MITHGEIDVGNENPMRLGNRDESMQDRPVLIRAGDIPRNERHRFRFCIIARKAQSAQRQRRPLRLL